MKAKYILMVLAAACVACGPDEPQQQEDNGPKTLQVTPTSRTSESGLAHDIVFKVICDGEFETSLEDGTWVTITGRKQSSGEAVDITVHLGNNTGSESRTESLVFTAGKLQQTATITQKPIGKLLPEDSVTLGANQAISQSWTLPGDWTAKCCNADGTDADWFSIKPDNGVKNTVITVIISPLAPNYLEEERNGYIEVTLGEIVTRMEVSQKSSQYGVNGFGVYNYDGKDSSLEYIPVQHQYSLKTGDKVSLRVVSLSENKFIVLNGLERMYNVGDKLSLVLFQNWNTSFPYQSDYSVSVIKTTAEKVWMTTEDNICFVVPK